MAIDISNDLNIFVQVISTQTATISGAYDTGSPPDSYLPGKDFSAADSISNGLVTSYKLGISLTSKSNKEYSIDKLFLQSADDPKTNGTGAIPLYLLNSDSDPANVTDNGLYTALPNYSANMASVVFDKTVGITSTSTVNMTLNVNYPSGIYWKTKIAPNIQVVAVKDSVQKVSPLLKPPEVRMSSFGKYNTDFLYYPIEWSLIKLINQNGLPGFSVPFHFLSSMSSASNIGKLLNTPNITSITYSANLSFTIDGTSIPLTTGNVDITPILPNGMMLQSFSLTAGKLIITLAVPQGEIRGTPRLDLSVFLPYDPGSKASVTMAMVGSWDVSNNGGVKLEGWLNSYIMSETQTGGINASQVIPLITPPPIPHLSDNVVNSKYGGQLGGNLSSIGYNFLSVSNSQMLLLYDDPNAISHLGNDADYLSVAYSVNGQLQTPYTALPSEYRQQYAYVPLPVGYDPTAIARAVFSGGVFLGSYQAILNAGHTPNVIMTTLLSDLISKLNADLTKNITISFGSSTILNISSSDFLARYRADPTNSFTSKAYVAMRVGTDFASVAAANALYSSQLGTGDMFLSVDGKVYLDLATTTAQPLLQRFNGHSHVMSAISPPKSTAYFGTSITYDSFTPIDNIYDYTQSYPLRFFIVSGPGHPISSSATLSAGMKITFAVPANIKPYLYIVDNPRFYDSGNVPVPFATVTDYALTPAGIVITVPQDILMTDSNYLEIPVKFILPNMDQLFTQANTSYDPSKVMLYAPGSIVENFPAGTAFFRIIHSYDNTTLQSAGVDFSGLSTNRQYYPNGTPVDFIATIKNQLNLPTDLYLAMTVPTNQYNPLSDSNNNQPAYIVSITAFNPATVLYYQTASRATPADISAMQKINQPGTNLGQYYNSTIISSWTKYIGGALPPDVVLLAAYTPQVPQDTAIRVDYGVMISMTPISAFAYETPSVFAAVPSGAYVNNAVINYYSAASNVESQSNSVSISNYDITDAIPINKSPASQQFDGVSGAAGAFSFTFTLPPYAADFRSLTFNDIFPPALFYQFYSATIRIGTGAPQPLDMKYNLSDGSIFINFSNLNELAGNEVTIQVSVAVGATQNIPTSLHDTNQATLMINGDPTLMSYSNIVDIYYVYNDEFHLQKQPLYQNGLRINGQIVQFYLYFDVPKDVTQYNSIIVTDTLHDSLSYDAAGSILQIGTTATYPLNASLSGQTVTIDFTRFASAAGQRVMITLAAILSDISKLPQDNTVQNSALITLNKTPAFSFASNTVTAAFGAAPTRIPVTKAPIVQTVPSSVGAPVVFTLGFTLPQDTFGYGSITITDSLAPELLYDSAHSTISFGAEAATPLKASVAGNSVTVELMSLDAHAGEAVLITLAATVAAIPASGKLLNIAELMVNHDLSLLSTSNEVTVSFGRLPQVSPAKTASASTYKPDTDAEIDFTITYPSANIGNNTTSFSISDIIDSNLQVVSYNLSISPSSELFISDQSIENTVQYEINTAYPQGSTSVFPDSFTLKIKAKYQAHTITDPAYVIENTAFVDFGSGMLSSNVVRIAPTSESQHAINDLIESVALEQTALSHILNAEGEKIQAALAMPSISVDMTLRVNASVRSMIDSVSRLEMVLSGKLHLFKNIIEK